MTLQGRVDLIVNFNRPHQMRRMRICLYWADGSRCYLGEARVSPRNHVVDGSAHWRYLVNTESILCGGGDAVCRYHYCTNFLIIFSLSVLLRFSVFRQRISVNHQGSRRPQTAPLCCHLAVTFGRRHFLVAISLYAGTLCASMMS